VTDIKAEILRWVEDDPPGFVECGFIDCHGREWRFVVKLPYVSADPAVDSASNFPLPCFIECEIVRRRTGSNASAIVEVDTERPHHICSAEDVMRFEVFEHQLVEVPFGWEHHPQGKC
jgi:hypothetical protein